MTYIGTYRVSPHDNYVLLYHNPNKRLKVSKEPKEEIIPMVITQKLTKTNARVKSKAQRFSPIKKRVTIKKLSQIRSLVRSFRCLDLKKLEK